MADCSPQEQLMLELVNRARMNPAAEAARFGISLNQGLPAGMITSAPKQVLAMNDLLVVAADRHSSWMLTNDRFDHHEATTLPIGRTGYDPDDRMRVAGYSFAGPLYSFGENISWKGVYPGPVNLTSAIVAQHGSLFLSAGHRANILDDGFREVGIGQGHGLFTSGGHAYDTSMVTQNFARSGTTLFVTGALYNDTRVNDDFYTVGEQLAGRLVSGGAISDTTGAGGGYELGFAGPGTQMIDFHLSPGVDIQVAVRLGANNVKVDIVDGRQIWTNGSLTLTGGPVGELHALGIQSLALIGSTGSEKLFGNAGRNTLIGNAGNDSLDGGLSADWLAGGGGSDRYYVDHARDVADETGGDGRDTVYSAVTFNLSDPLDAIGDLENLVLTGTAGINGIGNALDNAITGNSGANKLVGGLGRDTLNGRAGHDIMTGGGGSDSFVFSARVVAANSDRIADFSHLDDTIQLQNSVMTALRATGTLSASLFHKGASAHDSNDYIVYNRTTGELFYDPDGSGAQGQVLLATLSNKPADLAYNDFLVI